MAGYTAEQLPDMQRRMLDAALAIPGVTAAAYANTLPLNLDQLHSTSLPTAPRTCGRRRPPPRQLEYAVSPGYFEAAGTTLLAGRSFTWHDDRNAPRVAVVNRSLPARSSARWRKPSAATHEHGTARGSRWSASLKTESTRVSPRIRRRRCSFRSCNRLRAEHMAGGAVRAAIRGN